MSNTTASIQAAMVDLTNQLGKDDPDMSVVATTVTVLVGGALIDLRTIADAVSKLSNFSIERVGEIMRGSSDLGTTRDDDLDLTQDEWATIEALRRGDIRTVSTSEPDERERLAMKLMRDHVALERSRGVELVATPWAQLAENVKQYWREQADITGVIKQG